MKCTILITLLAAAVGCFPSTEQYEQYKQNETPEVTTNESPEPPAVTPKPVATPKPTPEPIATPTPPAEVPESTMTPEDWESFAKCQKLRAMRKENLGPIAGQWWGPWDKYGPTRITIGVDLNGDIVMWRRRYHGAFVEADGPLALRGEGCKIVPYTGQPLKNGDMFADKNADLAVDDVVTYVIDYRGWLLIDNGYGTPFLAQPLDFVVDKPASEE